MFKRVINSGCVIKGILPSLLLLLYLNISFGATKTTVHSGSWNDASTWSPAGVPAAGDNAVVANGHVIMIGQQAAANNLSIAAGGTLQFSPDGLLTLIGNLVVDGTINMTGSIDFLTKGAGFDIGASGLFTWNPKTNTAAATSLFLNAIENFHPSGTLVIKKWFDYHTPVGSIVSGNFGNLTLSTIQAGYLSEWDQQNEFEKHQIKGTLTIDQAWVVLDRTGQISNTIIGKIALLNANSYLDLHGGTHPGSFKVTTSEISIHAGKMNGIYDGEGNVSLEVTGDVSISSAGSLFLIYNDGIISGGNGNATLKVHGEFNQASGDFRGIYNLATFNAGITDLNFNNVTLTGGIFMGQYACHPGGKENRLIINGNLNISYTHATDKFRATGLSQLSGVLNTSGLLFFIGGDLTVSGNTSAEFFSQVASGNEQIIINGNAIFNGCFSSFGYGVDAAAHPFNLNFNRNVLLQDGTLYFSRIGGNGTTIIQGDLSITGGNLMAKGDAGIQQVEVKGNFRLDGGSFFLHSNTGSYTTDVIKVTVAGAFIQSGGTLNFDDNTSPQSSTHILQLNGQAVQFSGGMITHALAGTGNSFGQLSYSRAGTISYFGNDHHHIQQVRQSVTEGCTLEVISGDLQVSSHAQAGTDYFRVQTGGTLAMHTGQIYSNMLSSCSGIRIEKGGDLQLERPQGLYDGTSYATIKADGAMNYFLDLNSIVEYAGKDNQVITGTGKGIATTNNHKYGILKINMNNSQANAKPATSSVYVRTELMLDLGVLDLDRKAITIESGGANAISRTDGYIRYGKETMPGESKLKWKHITAEDHVFPFGILHSDYLPVTFKSISGQAADISISTGEASAADKQSIEKWYAVDALGYQAEINITWRVPDQPGKTPVAIERSSDGKNFITDDQADKDAIQRVNNYYSAWIRLIPGSSYYRLKMSDSGGNITYSKSAYVLFSGAGSQPGQQAEFSQVYPNPFRDRFTADYFVAEDGTVMIELVSLSGQVVVSEEQRVKAGNNRFEFAEKARIPSGSYILRIRGARINLSKQVIKNL